MGLLLKLILQCIHGRSVFIFITSRLKGFIGALSRPATLCAFENEIPILELRVAITISRFPHCLRPTPSLSNGLEQCEFDLSSCILDENIESSLPPFDFLFSSPFASFCNDEGNYEF